MKPEQITEALGDGWKHEVYADSHWWRRGDVKVRWAPYGCTVKDGPGFGERVRRFMHNEDEEAIAYALNPPPRVVRTLTLIDSGGATAGEAGKP